MGSASRQPRSNRAVVAPTEALATPQEVAAYLQVSELTVKRWRYRLTGPRWATVGRHVRYRWEDVEAWLDLQAKTGGTAA